MGELSVQSRREVEEQQRLEEQRRQAEEQKRRAEEQKRLEEQRRQAEEQKRRAEEQKRLEEQRRRAEEQKRLEEQRRQAEEQKRQAEEQKRLEEQRRRQEFAQKLKQAEALVSSDLAGALSQYKAAGQFAPDLCDQSYRTRVRELEQEQEKREKAKKATQERFMQLYVQGTELVASDPERGLGLLQEAQQLAPHLCDDNFRQWVVHAKQEAAKPKKVPWSQIRRIIDLYRPSWLPAHVARNEGLDAMPGPRSGGSLVQLLDLPSGFRRKVILARDGSPLLEMVEIPAGKFLMGSSDRDPKAGSDEKPQREVYLNAYWIARTPITNRMWQKFLQESGYQPPRDNHDGDYLNHWEKKGWFSSTMQPPADKLDHPVVYVSYIAVWAFCDYYGLMLPSEAQWEKAARGVDGRIWPWGDQQPTPELCNFDGSRIGTTTPVGKYPQGISPFGLVDCAGNVWEWCADEYSGNLLQELDPNSGRVIRLCNNRANSRLALRGGSFNNYSEFVRCAYRYYFTAVGCYYFIGFRPSQDVAL
jgi:formylglycine-generating enzyme required for sulfatase activity